MGDSESRIENLLMEMERDAAAAIVRKDGAALDSLFADDYSGTSADGQPFTRSQFMAWIRSPSVQFESFDLSDLAIRAYGDTAVVTGLLTVEGRAAGRYVRGLERFTDVWIRREGRWQVVATQNTRIAEEPVLRSPPPAEPSRSRRPRGRGVI